MSCDDSVENTDWEWLRSVYGEMNITAMMGCQIQAPPTVLQHLKCVLSVTLALSHSVTHTHTHACAHTDWPVQHIREEEQCLHRIFPSVPRGRPFN